MFKATSKCVQSLWHYIYLRLWICFNIYQSTYVSSAVVDASDKTLKGRNKQILTQLLISFSHLGAAETRRYNLSCLFTHPPLRSSFICRGVSVHLIFTSLMDNLTCLNTGKSRGRFMWLIYVGSSLQQPVSLCHIVSVLHLYIYYYKNHQLYITIYQVTGTLLINAIFGEVKGAICKNFILKTFKKDQQDVN